jgi:hypothetical protein
MITALLLAVAVAGQIADEPAAKKANPAHAPIDTTYRPRANERAMVGRYDLNAPENQIAAVLSYSSVERWRKSYESLGEKAEDGGISNDSEGYLLRACTPVLVKQRLSPSYLDDGEQKTVGVVKVAILEGEFKGKELFLVEYSVFRFDGNQDRPTPVAMAPHKRSGRRPAPDSVPTGDSKLLLMDLTSYLSASGNYVNVDGRVRCTSDMPLKFVHFTISFEDRDGRLVRSADGYTTPNVLSPGDIGSISVSAQSDPRYARIKIDFKDSDKALPWVDQSGTNAHQ